MQFLLFTSCFFVSVLYSLNATKMAECDVKEALVKARNEGNLIGNVTEWLCLIHKGTQYSYDIVKNGRYGLLQIQSIGWCGEYGMGGQCKINCNELLNTNLADDIACAQEIFKRDLAVDGNGFGYWKIWETECAGKNLSNYGKECTGIYVPGSFIRFPLPLFTFPRK